MFHVEHSRSKEKKILNDRWFTQIIIFMFTDFTASKLPFLTFSPVFICVYLQFKERLPEPAFFNFFFLLSSSYGKVMTF
jgi:hypothetical protein